MSDNLWVENINAMLRIVSEPYFGLVVLTYICVLLFSILIVLVPELDFQRDTFYYRYRNYKCLILSSDFLLKHLNDSKGKLTKLSLDNSICWEFLQTIESAVENLIKCPEKHSCVNIPRNTRVSDYSDWQIEHKHQLRHRHEEQLRFILFLAIYIVI
jgi:hypothetical protein